MMADHDRLFELIPVYALGSATPTEAAEIEAHLDDCTRCLEELGMHLTTAAELDGPRHPSSRVWGRIDEAIDHTGVASATDLGERRRRRLLTSMLAVAAAFGFFFLGTLFSRISENPLGDSAVLAAAERAVGQEGSLVAELLVDDLIVARVILTVEGRGYVIPSDHLNPLDESRTYQLWVINTDDAAISAGVLGSDPAPAVFTWSGDVSGLALTREVAGGVVSSAGDVVSVVTDL